MLTPREIALFAVGCLLVGFSADVEQIVFEVFLVGFGLYALS